MKALNLDEFAPPKRKIVLHGKSYPVQEMDVDGYIQVVTDAKQLEEEADPAVRMTATIEAIMRRVPSMPREVLGKLSLDQLGVMFQFIQGTLSTEGMNDTTAQAQGAQAEGNVAASS